MWLKYGMIVSESGLSSAKLLHYLSEKTESNICYK